MVYFSLFSTFLFLAQVTSAAPNAGETAPTPPSTNEKTTIDLGPTRLETVQPPKPPPEKKIPLDNNAPGASPNTFTTEGGKVSPIYSSANAEASHFLTLIDQKAYKSAWADAGPLLKDIVTVEEFDFAMQGTRKPLGNLQVRKTPDKGAQNNVDHLPNGTKGLFIVLTFDSTFSGNLHAKETVTLMQNDRGQWRVVAYSVKANR